MKPIKIKITPHHKPEHNASGKQTVVSLFDDRLEYKVRFTFIDNIPLEDDELKEAKITIDEEGYILKKDIKGLFKNIQNEVTAEGVNLAHSFSIAYSGGAVELSCSSEEEKTGLYSTVKNWHLDIKEGSDNIQQSL